MVKVKVKVKQLLFTLWRHVGGSGVITHVIINLGTGCEGVVRFTPRPFYSRIRAPCCPLKRRLGAHLSRSEHRREEGVAPSPPPHSRSGCPLFAKHRWYLTAGARWSRVQYPDRVWLYIRTLVHCVGRGLEVNRLTARVILATCLQYSNFRHKIYVLRARRP